MVTVICNVVRCNECRWRACVECNFETAITFNGLTVFLRPHTLSPQDLWPIQFHQSRRRAECRRSHRKARKFNRRKKPFASHCRLNRRRRRRSNCPRCQLRALRPVLRLRPRQRERVQRERLRPRNKFRVRPLQPLRQLPPLPRRRRPDRGRPSRVPPLRRRRKLPHHRRQKPLQRRELWARSTRFSLSLP